jgi:hypothetical protein
MKNPLFKELMLAKALAYKIKFNSQLYNFPPELSDKMIEESEIETKQVCAKISLPLFNRLDDVSDDMGISKRSFIELALINALDEFDAIAKEYDIYCDPRDQVATDA